jgi:hypothetical protein
LYLLFKIRHGVYFRKQPITKIPIVVFIAALKKQKNQIKGGNFMYCPVCRAEYREGFIHCKKCDADLVDTLPPVDETELKSKNLWHKLLSLSIEKWLKVGGVTVIIASFLYDLIKTIDNLLQYSVQGSGDFKNVCFAIAGFFYSVIIDSMWGIFYISLAHIIALLKKGVIDEKNC